MGGGMPDQFERFGILVRDDGDPLALGQRRPQVQQPAAIHPDAEGGFRQPWPDAFRQGSARRPIRQLADGIVGKADLDGHCGSWGIKCSAPTGWGHFSLTGETLCCQLLPRSWMDKRTPPHDAGAC